MESDRERKLADARRQRASRDAAKRAGEWHGPRPMVQIVRSSTCPIMRLDQIHFRPDGTCMCGPPVDESLEPHIVKGTE